MSEEFACIILFFFLKEQTSIFYVNICCFFTIAGVLILIGVIVYASDSASVDPTGTLVRTYGAGFVLAIVAAIFAEASGAVFTAIKLKKEN